MFKNGMVAIAGAGLVLGSFLVVTDASAAGRGGHGGGHHAVNHAARAGGQKSTGSRYTAPNRNNGNFGSTGNNGGNFGLSGPYVGLKFIGNQ